MDELFSNLPKTRAEAKEIGSLYYFSNKVCKNGHISKRIVRNGGCYECGLERSKAWRANNKESFLERQKNYNEVNKDRRKAWYEVNKDRRKAQYKNYYENNKEAIKDYAKNYYAEKAGKTPEEIGTRRTPDPARYVYFLVVKDASTNEKLFLKLGISNNPTNRLKYHTRQLAKNGLIFDTILVKDFQTEEAARAIELKIKSSYIVYESGITGFTDECFLYLPQFEQSMLALLSK